MDHPLRNSLPLLDKISIYCLFIFAAFSMFSISITQIAAGIGGIAWLLRTHIAKNWHEQRWPLGIIFVLFALASLIAVVNAFDTSNSYKELRKLLEILIFFWVVNCVRENCLRDSLASILIVSATLASFYGFYQGWRDGVNIMNRVEGSMSVYMTFAGLLMMGVMVALGRLLFKKPTELLLLPAVGIICVCLLLTLTRQGWFGFLVGFTFLIFVFRKKQALILIGVILTISIVYGSQIQSQALHFTKFKEDSNPEFIESLKFRIHTIFSGRDQTFNSRLALWKGGWLVFKDHPLTGCGFKCVDLIHPQYPDPTGLIKKLRGMHNNFIQLAVDTGILGLSAWLGIWIVFFTFMHKQTKNTGRDSPVEWVIYSSSAAVIAFLAAGFFESNFYDSEVVMLLYFIMALPFADSNLNGSENL